tara:strand:- start:1568 stop:1948 length:381 start_codon:yes stop_codon:yes gene_type:complete
MGSTTSQSSGRTFQSTAVAIAPYALVALDSNGLVSVAGDNGTDHVIGVATEAIVASGYGNVQLLNAGGSIEVLCGGDTIAVDAIVYTDGSGKVGTAGANVKIGYALQASSTDGDVIEVIVHNHVFA